MYTYMYVFINLFNKIARIVTTCILQLYLRFQDNVTGTNLIKREEASACRYGTVTTLPVPHHSAYPEGTFAMPQFVEPAPVYGDAVSGRTTHSSWITPGHFDAGYQHAPYSDLNSMNDVETDRAPSIMVEQNVSAFQGMQLQGKIMDNDGRLPSLGKYPFDDKLMKYEGDDERNPSFGSIMKHERWQQKQQYVAGVDSTPTDDVMDADDVTFELDEFGDG